MQRLASLLQVDADMYVRQNTDSIFCSPTDHEKNLIAVTPRSSFDANVRVALFYETVAPKIDTASTDTITFLQAGFNAGMFVYSPSNAMFDSIMAKFLALSQVRTIFCRNVLLNAHILL